MTQKFPHVLVVDDCSLTARRLAKELSASGYMPRTAADGAKALQAMREGCPDYVITDWQMPNMDGEMLCRCIRSEDYGQYVYLILMTAHSDIMDLIDGLGAGADDYITKPVEVRELLARMNAGGRILDLDRRLTHVAQHDPLTGILNRRNLVSSVAEEMSLCQRRDRPVACIMLDLDHFKRINDQFGHLAGDTVLVQVASLLQKHFRAGDFVCRYGGEEFAIILPNCDEAGAEACSERCREDIQRCIGVDDVKSCLVTASFGVAEGRGEVSPLMLVENADMALRQAKSLGRNRVVKFSSIAVSEPVNVPVLDVLPESNASTSV